ncbi:hypothetical protein ACHWQZ_G005654 [Mnemiopsis leidyi]
MYNIVKDGNGNSVYLTGRVEDLQREETCLRSLISDLQDRIEWLKSGSREKFGVVTEKRVVLVVDSYEISNVTFGSFCSAVAGLIREQIVEIDSFNVVRACDNVSQCWTELRDITRDNLRQSLAFVLSQQPTMILDRDTLCEAVKSAIDTEGADGIYLLIQGSPHRNTHEYLARLVRDSKVPVNTCLYGAADTVFSSLLTEIAANSGGRWHRFTETETQSKGTAELRNELNKARDILAEVSALRLEIQLKNEPKLPQLPPKSQEKSEKDMTSAEWLNYHGLKSSGARFYDALAPQAFRHCDKVVKVGDSDKIVNAKYCQKFAHVKWWDGSVKHVIINQNFYEKYKTKIENITSTIERRIKWVEQSSKTLFGTLLEDNVCILLDTSHSMEPHLTQLKKRVSPENLQSAWRWCSTLQCTGSTNTLDALKFGLSLTDVHGLYLLTDGSPDLPEEKILSQIKLYKEVPIHTISFNCDDRSANEFLCSLAQETAARFHVVRSDKTVEYNGPDPYESTDIKLLKLEIETAELDLKKMSELRAECEILEWKCVKRPPTKPGNGPEKSRKRKNVKKPADLSDTESVMSGTGVFSARKWLAKYGLVPQKLTIMDALAPTVITQQPKYVGVLKKKVHAKVFDDVMPFAFLSPEDKDRISFVNPAGVDLLAYEKKVRGAVALYDSKIAAVIWKKLKEEEKKKFISVSEDEVPGFTENRDLFRSILETAGWPVSQKTVKLMSEEIELGELYLTQSAQLREHMDKSAQKEKSLNAAPRERKNSGGSLKSDSYLLGYRVVAQNSVDGFYYPGTVIGNRGRTKCEVEFDDFDRQIVFVNNLIPTQGSTSRPKVKAGDYVLVQLMLSQRSEQSKQKLLAPGLVVKSPEHSGDVTFIILLFTGERLIASRHDVIKITKNRYKQTSQAIFKQLSRQRSSQRLRLVAEGQECNQGDDTMSVASTLDEILKSNLLLNKPSSVSGDGTKLDDMLNTPRLSEVAEEEDGGLEGKLNDLNLSEDGSDTGEDFGDVTPPARHITQCDVAVETQQEMAKVTLECGLQVGGYDVDAQTHISNDFWEDLDKMKYSSEEIIHPSEILVRDELIPFFPHINIPVLKVSATTPIQTDDILSVPDIHDLTRDADSAQSVVLEGEEQHSVAIGGRDDDDVTVVTYDAKIVQDDDDTLSSSSSSSSRRSRSSSSSSSSDNKVENKKKNGVTTKDMSVVKKEENSVVAFSKGLVVLARWADEGWYFRGKIVEPTKTGYLVEDNAGHTEDIDHKHVLVDEQDVRKSLSAGCHVIALHPDYSFSYAPARITGTDDNWFFDLKFYDSSEAEVPREEMYYISAEQYHEDTKFIRDIEEALLGSFVVVRDNSDGLYRRGMVTRATGRSYEISLNGDTILQDPAQVFTDYKKSPNQTLLPGSHCICPLDDLQNSFSPAKVVSVNKDGSLRVVFHDDSELYSVETDSVYPVTEEFYVNSVNYIQSR